MLVNRNEFVSTFAFALDFLELGLRDNITCHNKRVGLIAVRLGQELGLNDRDLFDLSAYAMLHDNGLTHKTYNILADDGLERLETTLSHCIKGEENLRDFPFMKLRQNIIKYHHEAHDGSGFFGISGEEIPLFSRIIVLADAVEIAWQSDMEQEDIVAHIVVQKGLRFAPMIVEAFVNLARTPGFWLSLGHMFVERELAAQVPVFEAEMEYPAVLRISNIMCGIIDAKSPFTGSHSKSLSEKAGFMADYYGYNEEEKIRLMIAADLHDTGKLVVPNSIIDKPGKLTASEFATIKSHTYYTRKVLETMSGAFDICEWASNHHEKLDGSGYPYGFGADRLDFNSRLMACLDIYQALTEERPYREGLGHHKAVVILEDMALSGQICPDITSDIKTHFLEFEYASRGFEAG